MIKKDSITLILERLEEIGCSKEEAIEKMNKAIKDPLHKNEFLEKAPKLIAKAMVQMERKIFKIIQSPERDLASEGTE